MKVANSFSEKMRTFISFLVHIALNPYDCIRCPFFAQKFRGSFPFWSLFIFTLQIIFHMQRNFTLVERKDKHHIAICNCWIHSCPLAKLTRKSLDKVKKRSEKFSMKTLRNENKQNKHRILKVNANIPISLSFFRQSWRKLTFISIQTLRKSNYCIPRLSCNV